MQLPRVVAALAVLAGCGEDPPAVAPLYRADPLAADNPIPDDRLRDGGGLRLADRAGFWTPYVPSAAQNPTLEAIYRGYAEHLGADAGWGTNASIVIGFDGALDPETVTAAGFRVAGAGLPPVDLDVAWHADPGFVTLQPRGPLTPGALYHVAVLRTLEAGGRPIAPAAELDAAAVTAAAGELAIDPGEIALAFAFTTGAPSAELVAAVDSMSTRLPTADFTVVPNNPRWPRGVMTRDAFLATFPAGDQRDELTTSLATTGTIAIGTYDSLDFRDAAGVLGTSPTAQDIEFVLVLPDPALHPPPWPVTIIQHGLQASSLEVFLRARAFTDAGIAAIGIDAVEHGIRGNISGFLVPGDLRVVRDNFRQSVLDLVQLCRLAAAADLDVVAPAGRDLDGRCFYIGQSFGGVLGGMYASVSPDTDIVVLNVAGGGITRILQSPSIGGLVRLLFQPALGLTGNDPGWDGNLPFYSAVSQSLLDPADPLNYGARVLDAPDRRVLMQSGLGDTLVPDAAARALADAIGIPQLTAATTDAGGVSGQWWVDLVDFGITPSPADTDPHAILNLVPGVPRQAATYMTSGGTEVVDPAAVNAPF